MLNALYLEFIVVGLAVIMLLAESFLGRQSRGPLIGIGVLGLLGVLVLTFFSGVPERDAGWASWAFYAWDQPAIFFKQLSVVTTILVLLMSAEFLAVLRRFIPAGHDHAGVGEFVALPLLACAGMMWMASAQHFAMMFVALELTTITLYILVAYQRRNLLSLEAGVKYLILGALSTGILVYGITWIYGLTGALGFADVAAALPSVGSENALALSFGFALVLIGLLFKVGSFPFQIWIPDVYQGAAAPVTTLLSVGSKAAGFVVLLRFLECAFAAPSLWQGLSSALPWFAGLTLLIGNLVALPQNNAKRLLAYSSIAHAGFLLMAVAAVSPERATGPAIAFYLAIYLLVTSLAFYAITIVTRATGSDEVSAFNGLGKRSPLLAFGTTISMIGLAGLPFTGGFFAKIFVFLPAIEAGHYFLVAIGVVGVAAGIYYYLKLVRAMFWISPTDEEPIKLGLTARVVVVALTVGILASGVYPLPLMQLAGF